MLKNYESMIVLAPTFSEDDLKKEVEKISSFIDKGKDDSLKIDEWGKKKLAYEINDFNEGFYFVFNYKFDAKEISELENFLKLNEFVIRYNIIKK